MIDAPQRKGGNPGKPLRIIVFTKDFLPGPGGVQKHIFLFAAGLAKEGHHTTVVTESPAEGFDDTTLPFPVLRRVGLIRLLRLIAAADIIHLAGPPFIPLLISFLLGKPTVIEHHGYHAICPNGLLLFEPDRSACPGHFMRKEYAECLRCVSTSQGSLRSIWQLLLTFPRRWLCRRGAGFNVTVSGHVEKRLQLPRSLPIYHGIPDPLAGGEKLVSIAPAPLCFAYVGRLVAEKGLPVLVEAASRLLKRGYEFRLKFVGDGPERDSLEKMVADQGLSGRVAFTGFLSGAEFDRATEEVSVVVMPSIMEETAGLAAMEQMMRGRLVIASDIGGLGEIVDGVGLKFEVGSVDQLASCMQQVLDQRDLVDEIGLKARQRALELFTEDRKITEYLLLYRELLRSLGEHPKRLATFRPGRVTSEPAFNLMMFTHDWAPSVGGIQTVYTRLASQLSDWPNTHEGIGPSVTLVTDTSAGGTDDSQYSFSVLRKPSLAQLVRHIRSSDVVHIGGPALLPLAAAVVLRKPLVVEHHGYQSICPNGLLLHEPESSVCPGHFMKGNYRKCIACNSGSLGWIRSSWNLALTFPRRWLARKATVNVAPSHHIERRLRLPRTEVIRHGIPVSPDIERVSSTNGHEGNSVCFAYVGRLVREKGIPVFLQAAARLLQSGYDLRIKIIGDGSERLSLEQLAMELGLGARAEFLGSVEPGQIDRLLAGTNAVVIPSICEDVAPLVAIEQMMQGRLIIGSDLGGLTEILEGVGLKFAAGDASALEESMRYVLKYPDLANELGDKARLRAQQVFTEERMISDHLKLYRSLVSVGG